MIDREKVIRAVDSCFDYWLVQHRCLQLLELENVQELKADTLALLKDYDTQLQYRDDHIAMYQAEIQRLEALLKKQEPILLENQHKPHGISTNANSPWVSRCPRCGKKVEGKQTRFCKYCGQAVKWND